MRKLQIFSAKYISYSHHSCYMNASLQLVIWLSVNSFLPTILENPSVLNKCLQLIKEHLDKKSSYPYNFLQQDLEYPTAKESVMAEVLFQCMNKDYKNNEMVDFFFKLVFTPCKAEQPLRGMELQEKEAQKV